MAIILKRIEFIITWQCSGHCRHCSEGNRPTSVHPVEPELLVRAVREAAECCPLESVMTFGGEALLCLENTLAVHRAAADCSVPNRQLITNGFFSTNPETIHKTAFLLVDAGVNDILLSVDAFHQETIPLEPVIRFAEALLNSGVEHLELQPSWVVDASHENEWNRKTREALAAFHNLPIPVGKGDNVFPAGYAAETLTDYFKKVPLNLSAVCGEEPYTERMDELSSLSVEPDGRIMACSVPIGDLKTQSMRHLLQTWKPQDNPLSKALSEGGVGLLSDMAKKRGICLDSSPFYSACEYCRALIARLTAE